jgi:CoA:oxalate CoA-transferase
VSDDRIAAPLEGVVVLELAHYAAGPFATLQLADAGARVIKVEAVGSGEHYRRSGDRIPTADGGTSGAYFLRFNRNKQSLALDVRSVEGYQVFLDLAAAADILVTNLLPATLESQRLDYESLRGSCPALVYTSISGFGHHDVVEDLVGRPAFASVVEARSGFMLQVGDPDCRPHRSGVSLADLAAGLYAALGSTLALRQRELTGLGQHVDVSLHDAMVAFNERAVFTAARTGGLPSRGTEGTFWPFDSYPTRDGWVVICVMTEGHWRALCDLVGDSSVRDDSRFADGMQRGAHAAEIDAWLGAWTRHNSATEAEQLLVAAGVPATVVLDASGVLEDEQARRRGMVRTIEDSYHGDHVVVGSPMRLLGDRTHTTTPPPPLGNATDSVLSDLLGLDLGRLNELRRGGLIS